MQELGRTRLESAVDTITVDFADKGFKKYLKIICALQSVTDVTNANLTFNNDTGSNYAKRTSENGGADATAVSQANIALQPTSRNNPKFIIIDVINEKTKEKLVNASMVGRGTAGAANAPNRVEGAHKWANTTALISRVDIANSGAGDYDVGSEVIVLGSDFPDGEDFDDDFWKEIGRKELNADAEPITINPIQPKKYLKIVSYLVPTGGAANPDMILNNDSGSNYARRASADGSTDSTIVSQTEMRHTVDSALPNFIVTYIINIANKEKLIISEIVNQKTAGAGTAPSRGEYIFKWANTTALISRIDWLGAGAGTWKKGSEMIIYGSD